MISVSPIELYQFLKNKGIKHLYFATTVRNACSMINLHTLMSNHQLTYQKMPMTPPINPDFQKFVSMWNKIPVYFYDLHGYFTRQNKLGPVCFVLDIDFLLEVDEKDLTITKRNPLLWKKGIRSRHICYSSVNQFTEDFDRILPERLVHKSFILVRDKRSEISIEKYVSEIILDMPAHRYMLYKKAKNALTVALDTSGTTHIPIKTRNCGDPCFCQKNYSKAPIEEIEKLFKP